jgi:hypothetical protein
LIGRNMQRHRHQEFIRFLNGWWHPFTAQFGNDRYLARSRWRERR